MGANEAAAHWTDESYLQFQESVVLSLNPFFVLSYACQH